ncbi:MAG: sugar transferase [Bacteroidetes bacterium]|nr:sugar transferase [Bacteroidota bacterium]
MKCATKYIFDRLLALVALVFLFPVLLSIALAIKSSSHGPVFFRQIRVGKDRRLFSIIKFRTMVNNQSFNTFTTSEDPRITSLGRFLRKWKLDELPELVNVLLGEMSFVGPRPDVPGYADVLKGEEQRILSLRPGITGPATLKYFFEEEILAGVKDPKEYNDLVIFPDKVKINMKYLEKHSLIVDLKIIIYTILRKQNYEY